VISWVAQAAGLPGPKKPASFARSRWGLELRKQWSHQGLWRCMFPHCWLPRRSWRLEHNQCHGPFNFFLPGFFPELVLPGDLLLWRGRPRPRSGWMIRADYW